MRKCARWSYIRVLNAKTIAHAKEAWRTRRNGDCVSEKITDETGQQILKHDEVNSGLFLVRFNRYRCPKLSRIRKALELAVYLEETQCRLSEVLENRSYTARKSKKNPKVDGRFYR